MSPLASLLVLHSTGAVEAIALAARGRRRPCSQLSLDPPPGPVDARGHGLSPSAPSTSSRLSGTPLRGMVAGG